MRTVKLEDGSTAEAKSLRWKTVRQLRAENLTPDTITQYPEAERADKAETAILRVLNEAFGEERAQALYENGTYADVLALYHAVWAETLGVKAEEKN